MLRMLYIENLVSFISPTLINDIIGPSRVNLPGRTKPCAGYIKSFLGYKEEQYYMADDEVNKASTSFLRNRFERYYLRLKMLKFLKLHE